MRILKNEYVLFLAQPVYTIIRQTATTYVICHKVVVNGCVIMSERLRLMDCYHSQNRVPYPIQWLDQTNETRL